MDQQQLFWQLVGFGTVAGLIPVYLGIAAALLAIKVLNRSWEGFLTGTATGILVYLFFDLMHEAVELTSAKDPTSWVIFLGSLLFGFVGLVAIEQRQQGRNRFEVPRLFLPYMIAPVVVDLTMTIHVLMKLPTIDLQVEFCAASAEQCKIKAPACYVVLRLRIEAAGTQGMKNDAFPLAVEYRLPAALSRLGRSCRKGSE